MKLLLLLIGNQLDGILLTGNTLRHLLFYSGLTIGHIHRNHRKVHYYAWYRIWDSDIILTF